MTRIVDRRSVRPCLLSVRPPACQSGRRVGISTGCSQAAGGGVEYRLREGLRNPLEENPDTDTWKPASECDPATVAEAET